MAGLMNPTGAAPAAPPPSGARPNLGAPMQDDDRVGDDEGGEEVSPEEQAEYDAFVKSARALIGESGENILALLDDDPTDLKAVLGDIEQLNNVTPPLALAAAAVIVVLEAVRRSGETRPSDDVIQHGGQELLETIADLGEKAGIHDYTQDELNQAWLMANDLYREAAAAEGMVDLDALKGQFDEIVTADKEGRLDSVLPGLRGAAVDERPTGPAEPGEPAITKE